MQYGNAESLASLWAKVEIFNEIDYMLKELGYAQTVLGFYIEKRNLDAVLSS